MSHEWHHDTIERCLDHAQSYAQSILVVLRGEHITTSMQHAVAKDIEDILRDIKRCIELRPSDPPDKPRDSYVQHLEGVIFVQLHQIQQLQKEVARHAAPA